MTSEQTPLLNPTQQQETAHRMIHDGELLQNGTYINALGKLVITAEQYSSLHYEMDQSLVRTSPVEAISLTQELNLDDKEKARAVQLSEIVGSSGIALATWLRSGIIPGRNSSVVDLHSATMPTPESSRLTRIKTAGEPFEQLNKLGVSEIITFSQIDSIRQRSKIPGHRGEQDEVVIMTYETTHNNRTRAHKHNMFPMGVENGAPGADLVYQLIMTPERAQELESMISENPEAAHELTDTIMVEQFGADKSAWHKWGPQYDAWREAHGGTMRMAIRHDLNSAADQSSVVEY